MHVDAGSRSVTEQRPSAENAIVASGDDQGVGIGKIDVVYDPTEPLEPYRMSGCDFPHAHGVIVPSRGCDKPLVFGKGDLDQVAVMPHERRVQSVVAIRQ